MTTFQKQNIRHWKVLQKINAEEKMITLKDFQVAACIVNSKGLVDCLQSSGSR